MHSTLALASYHKCDFLGTWNCRHLANANKFGHIRRVNTMLGLLAPALVTPLGCSEAAMIQEQRSDPIIDEAREIRQRISARFDHDPARLVAYYIELQERHRDRLIDRPKAPERGDDFAA